MRYVDFRNSLILAMIIYLYLSICDDHDSVISFHRTDNILKYVQVQHMLSE